MLFYCAGMDVEQCEILLPGGMVLSHRGGVSCAEVLSGLPSPVREEIVAVKVGGVLRDVAVTLPSTGRVELISLRSPEGLEILRHSAAHLMAAAMGTLFPGVKFAIGPAIETGFYYDVEPPESLGPEDLRRIEDRMRELAARALPYVRTEMTMEDALATMKRLGQTYKMEILEAIQARHDAEGELLREADASGGAVTFYRTGEFLDLCRGPHVPDTGKVKVFQLTHLAGAYWRGDEKRPMLTRVYGTAFPTREELDLHLQRLEEAKRRDHRRLGRDLDLFSVDEEVGSGLILWHPKGGILRKVIEDFWRAQHLENGYDLVFTPHVGRGHLWKTSGHLDFYHENMYAPMNMEGSDYYVRPMNCPFHIKIYQSRMRSYRELPLRLAELGTVYRFERAGVLHGLLRVRGFTQDDAHIFCTPDQVETEIARALEFSLFFLRTFGFEEYEACIATRPERFVGDPADWARATEALKGAASRVSLTYTMDEAGGAFYGPKIDIKIKDTLGRPWQCTTVQFDFNLPDRFDITFVGEDNRPHRPFMVHRALLGSLERFLGVLIEHYAGAFPLWLAPVQVRVLPLTDHHHAYAHEVTAALRAAGCRVEEDARNEKVGFKIRDAEIAKVPYIIVVGDREAQTRTVAVRARGRQDRGTTALNDFVALIRREYSPPGV